MKESDLIERLTAFGIDEREAKVYYHLSRMGPARASEIGRASGVQRTEVYRVMDSLETAGFVEKTLERPRKFVAINIEEALQRRLENRHRELEELEDASDELSELWPRTQREAERQARFSVHQDRAQIRGLLERMVDGASDEILVMTLRRGLNRLDTRGVLDKISQRAGDGVAVRILTELDERSRETVAPLAKACKLRHVELPGYAQMVIVDNEQIAIFVSLDPVMSTQGTGETVLWLNAQDFILTQKAIFDTIWATGIDYDERFAELSTGEPAARTEVVRGRWMRYNRMKEMLYRAEKQVRLVAPRAEAARLERAGILPMLQRVANRGIRVELLFESGEHPEIQGVEVTEIDPPGVVVLDIDATEVLIAAGAGQAPDSMTHDGEWAIWSTVPEKVALITDML